MKFIFLPFIVFLVMFFSPWVNWVLAKNLMLTDPNLTFKDASGTMWAAQWTIYGVLGLTALVVHINNDFK